MDKVYLRSIFLREKTFLKDLYLNVDVSKTLTTANDRSLDVLLKILHLIATGEISIKKNQSMSNVVTKKLIAFESKKHFLTILNSNSREQKLKALKIFQRFFSTILYTFFNEI